MAPERFEGAFERIVRLETKLDLLLTQLDKLPPSPTCIAEHKIIHTRITDLNVDLDKRITGLEAWRNRAIGALMIINIILVLVMDKIANFLGIK